MRFVRRAFPLLFSIVALGLLPSNSVRAAGADALEKEVMQAENRLMDAIRKRDKAELEKLVGAEFAYTGPLSTGDLTRKDQFIGGNLGGIRLETFHFEKNLVRGFGDLAVVNTLCRQTGSVGNRPWNPDYLFTDVWVKKGGAWQIVSRHVTRPIKIETAKEAPKAGPVRPSN